MGSVSKRDFAVSVSPYLGRVSYFSGGVESKASNKVYNGGAEAGDVITGRTVISNIIVRKPYDPRQSGLIAKTMRHYGDTKQYAVTKQDLDKTGARAGSSLVYSGCTMVRCEFPDYDEQTDAEPAFLEVEFSVSSVAAR